MKNGSVRVVVASEFPEVRYLLKKMIGRGGGVTVGQAQDAPKALALVKTVKPDVAIIDCYLPYVTGLHVEPQSRIGGLDIAQTINREVPGTGVVLLNNLDAALSDRSVTSPDGATYSMRTIQRNMPLAIRNLRRAETRPGDIVFANLETEPEEPLKPNPTNPFDMVVFCGACGIVAGWFLMISWFSFVVGGGLAATGALAVILGMVGKRVAPLLARLFRGKS